jgi:hypothetical protein
MPRFTAPAPNSDSRKALEQRAREASKPVVLPQGKRRWPFPADDGAPQASDAASEGVQENAPGDDTQAS